MKIPFSSNKHVYFNDRAGYAHTDTPKQTDQVVPSSAASRQDPALPISRKSVRKKTLLNVGLFRITDNTYSSSATAAPAADSSSSHPFVLPAIRATESLEPLAQLFERWNPDGENNHDLITTPPSPQSSLATQPSLSVRDMAPPIVHGFKTQMRHLGARNKEWVQLRHAIKNAVMQQQWACFTEGRSLNNEQRQALVADLRKQLGDQPANQTSNAKKALQYLTARSNHSPIVSQHGTALFSHRGKNGVEKFVRTESGTIFRILHAMTPEINARIQAQQGNTKPVGGVRLGKGNAGQVSLAEKIGPGGHIVAVKALDIRHIETSDHPDAQKIFLLNECDIYKTLPKNSVHFSQVREFARNVKGNTYLFMDLGIHGDLTKVKSKIDAETNAVKRKQLKRTVAKQCIVALKELHANKIYHQDIKSPNLLVSKTGDVVITDFGVSSRRDQCIEYGSSFYEPPEGGDRSYKSKGDLFSLGMTLRELADVDSTSNLVRRFDHALPRSSSFHLIRNMSHRRFTSINKSRDVASLKGETLMEVGLRLAAHKPELRLDFDAALDLPYFQDPVTKKEREVYESAQLARFLNDYGDWDQ